LSAAFTSGRIAMDLMSITTILFDFDGTLASSLEGIHVCFREALFMNGYPEPSLEDVRRTVGLTLEESVRRLTHGQCDGEQTEDVVTLYRALYTKKGRAMATLFPGAMETLAAVKAMGIRIALVSNKSHEGLRRLAAHLGIESCIDVMQGADPASFRKPDARLYTENLAPRLPEAGESQVLVVGDTDTDLLFARNASLRSCWAAYGYGDPEGCRALAPEFILEDIAQLPGLIRRPNSGE